MTLLIPHHQGCKLKLSASAAVLAFLMIVHCVSAVEPETCYSRQHQKAIVNVRLALNNQGVLMDARVVRSERDCVLACCSEEVKPGTKCNMVVFNGKKQHSEDNCFLFHCPAEQDCPLMKAVEGINTYDIYKGLIHLTTEKPTATTTVLTSTSSPTPTTMSSPPTTTTTTTTAATTTTITTTTQTSTTVLPPTTQSPTTSPALHSEPPRLIIITTIPAVDTTTTTTDVTSIPLRRPNKTSKKQNKNSKKGRLHPLTAKTTPVPTSATTTLHVDQEDAYRTAEEPQRQTELCTTTPTTTTTTPTKTPTTTITTTATSTTTATTTTTTTAPPPTTSTTTDPPTTPTTAEKFSLITTTPAVSLLIVPKGVVQPEQPLQDQSQAKAATMGRGAVKSGVVAFMVLGLAVLTMALAIGGRKAMESFDRRHYTRLELNDLHYEV